MKEAWFFCMPEVGSAGKKVCSSLHSPATDGFKHVTRGTTHEVRKMRPDDERAVPGSWKAVFRGLPRVIIAQTPD